MYEPAKWVIQVGEVPFGDISRRFESSIIHVEGVITLHLH
jgi:hypothetical protein